MRRLKPAANTCGRSLPKARRHPHAELGRHKNVTCSLSLRAWAVKRTKAGVGEAASTSAAKDSTPTQAKVGPLSEGRAIAYAVRTASAPSPSGEGRGEGVLLASHHPATSPQPGCPGQEVCAARPPHPSPLPKGEGARTALAPCAVPLPPWSVLRARSITVLAAMGLLSGCIAQEPYAYYPPPPLLPAPAYMPPPVAPPYVAPPPSPIELPEPTPLPAPREDLPPPAAAIDEPPPAATAEEPPPPVVEAIPAEPPPPAARPAPPNSVPLLGFRPMRGQQRSQPAP